MKLFLTPFSHFSRKVRVITDLYALPVEYIDVGNVAEICSEKFADNPLMSVPVLSDNNIWLIDSDIISAYLIKNFCKNDDLIFFSNDLERNLDERNIDKLSYKNIHTACAIDHIRYFETVDLTPYNKLNKITEVANKNPKVYKSNPFLLRPKV